MNSRDVILEEKDRIESGVTKGGGGTGEQHRSSDEGTREKVRKEVRRKKG